MGRHCWIFELKESDSMEQSKNDMTDQCEKNNKTKVLALLDSNKDECLKINTDGAFNAQENSWRTSSFRRRQH
ncbi:hypothetical protein ACP70R_040733 [Stipagrostis hirtigluma subsp. patula]